jgi:hypothetical protein
MNATVDTISELGAVERLVAGLLPRPEKFKPTYVEILKWELFGLLLNGMQSDERVTGKRGPCSERFCLGEPNSSRGRVVGTVVKHAGELGWELRQTQDCPQPAKQADSRSARTPNPPGVKLLYVQLLYCSPTGSAKPAERLFLPSAASMSFLSQQFDGAAWLGLVWFLTHSLLVYWRADRYALFPFSKTLSPAYTTEVWQKASHIFSSRGWELRSMPALDSGELQFAIVPVGWKASDHLPSDWRAGQESSPAETSPGTSRSRSHASPAHNLFIGLRRLFTFFRKR